MIRNVVFDMVGVLFVFDTAGYYLEHGISAEDQQLLSRQVFRSLEWACQDRGSLTDEQVLRAILPRIPQRLWRAAEDFVRRQNRRLLPIEGMEELLEELKQRGLGLYLLSNTSHSIHSYFHQVPGWQYFEDTLFSADVGLVKPDAAIFHLACERFGIQAQESLFIDDTPINGEGALYAGMQALVFHGESGELRSRLFKALEEPDFVRGRKARENTKSASEPNRQSRNLSF